METNKINNELKKILIENLNLEISPDDIVGEDLVNELGINSIDAISIFIAIENTFDIFIEDENLNASLISSLDGLTKFISEKKVNND